jgi:uncharacterized protein (TIGR03067 family)
MSARCVLVVVAGLLVAADAKEDAAKEDLKKLEGTWVILSAEENGKQVPEGVIKDLDLRITITSNKVMLRLPQKKTEEATLTIDSTKKPKQIDLKSGDVEIRGIYSLDGDMLKMCAVKEQSKDRPTDFTTKDDDGHGLFVLKREKK